jgi:membrane protein implicated in regulation of membrane protease activity
MPKPTLVFAALLLALGLGAFALSGSRAALAIRAAQMSPLALGVNVGMLALSAALLAMMIRSLVVARRSRTPG